MYILYLRCQIITRFVIFIKTVKSSVLTYYTPLALFGNFILTNYNKIDVKINCFWLMPVGCNLLSSIDIFI